MPGSTTITASPSRITVTVPATRSSSPSRPNIPIMPSTNTNATRPEQYSHQPQSRPYRHVINLTRGTLWLTHHRDS